MGKVLTLNQFALWSFICFQFVTICMYYFKVIMIKIRKYQKFFPLLGSIALSLLVWHHINISKLLIELFVDMSVSPSRVCSFKRYRPVFTAWAGQGLHGSIYSIQARPRRALIHHISHNYLLNLKQIARVYCYINVRFCQFRYRNCIYILPKYIIVFFSVIFFSLMFTTSWAGEEKDLILHANFG